jgi:hypothetical protein
MFIEYYLYPGWWMSVMLILGKIKCQESEKVYKDFCDLFIEHLAVTEVPPLVRRGNYDKIKNGKQ